MSETDTRTRYDPDPEVVAERTPAACPFCGHDGVFDGQGCATDEIKTLRVGVETVYEATYTEHRCPECNGYFRMLDSAEKTNVEKTP